MLRFAKAVQRQQERAARQARGQAAQSLRRLGRITRQILVSDLRRLGSFATAEARWTRGESVRLRAPDTGGRSFHFEHSAIKRDRGDAARSTTTDAGARAAKHARYIDRADAVEKISISPMSADTAVNQGHSSSAQAYIEDTIKLDQIGECSLNFGSIGDTLEERVAFWNRLDAAETRDHSVIQHRIIAELPHDTTPAERLAIVKDFCRRFDEQKLPYWASIHAPTARNDSRNYHVHVVFSDRPFKKLEDGSYDFERIEIYTKAKHKREIRPFRQNKIREYNKKDFAFEARRRFAEAVNRHSKRQKFDPRSYKNMGYDVTPMGTVHGFVKNRSDDAPLLIDRERTREEVERKLRELDQTRLQTERGYFRALAEAIELALDRRPKRDRRGRPISLTARERERYIVYRQAIQQRGASARNDTETRWPKWFAPPSATELPVREPAHGPETIHEPTHEQETVMIAGQSLPTPPPGYKVEIRYKPDIIEAVRDRVMKGLHEDVERLVRAIGEGVPLDDALNALLKAPLPRQLQPREENRREDMAVRRDSMSPAVEDGRRSPAAPSMAAGQAPIGQAADRSAQVAEGSTAFAKNGDGSAAGRGPGKSVEQERDPGRPSSIGLGQREAGPLSQSIPDEKVLEAPNRPQAVEGPPPQPVEDEGVDRRRNRKRRRKALLAASKKRGGIGR